METKKLKEFRIGVYEEQGGFVTILAKSEKDAKKKVAKELENYGINAFRFFDCKNREAHLI